MSARPTIAHLTSQLAERDASLLGLYPLIRVASRMVPQMYDECDRFTKYTIDDTARIVVYAFQKARGGYDVVVAQIGTGAGEGVLNVECMDADVLVEKYERVHLGSDVALAYRVIADRVRHWITCTSRDRAGSQQWINDGCTRAECSKSV